MEYITFGVREFQAHLGDALRAAERGERVVITSRNRAVAMLCKVDVRLGAESAADRKLRRLAAAGRIRLGDPTPIAPFQAPRIGGLSKRVLSDRR
jgi:prevent-host-death family protein